MRAGTPHRDKSRGAFTLVELLVVMSVVTILFSLILTGLAEARSAAHMTECSSNLRQIALAATNYAQDNRDQYPRVHFDRPDRAGRSNVVRDDPAAAGLTDPFGITAPRNDVPAAMFLLLRTEYLPASDVFVSPSLSTHRPDEYGVNGPQATDQTTFTFIGTNTSDPSNLSYGYTNPYPGFGPTTGIEKLTLTLENVSPQQALFADRGPSNSTPYDSITEAPHDRSNVHGQGGEERGQHASYSDGRVVFTQSPRAGVALPRGFGRDPIYGEEGDFARVLEDSVIHPLLADGTFVDVRGDPTTAPPPAREPAARR